MPPILKLKNHNPRREIEFELLYLKSLSIKQRFILMFKKSEEMRRLMEKHGHRKSFEIVKRA